MTWPLVAITPVPAPRARIDLLTDFLTGGPLTWTHLGIVGGVVCGVVGVLKVWSWLDHRVRRQGDGRFFPQPAESSPTGPDERRHDERRKSNPVMVLVSDADAVALPVRGRVVNCAPGGLRLIVPQAAPTGMVLSVRPAHVAPVVPWVRVEVTNCHQVDHGWEVGCQFLESSAEVLWLFV